MNKTDQIREAEYWDSLGVDPDTVMVTQTIEEYAESHGEEVDYFDEDKKEIKQVKEKLEDISYMTSDLEEELQKVEKTIVETQEEIREMEEDLNNGNHTRSEEYGIKENIRDERAVLNGQSYQKSRLQQELALLKQKKEMLDNDFQEKQESFDVKYGR